MSCGSARAHASARMERSAGRFAMPSRQARDGSSGLRVAAALPLLRRVLGRLAVTGVRAVP